MKKLILCIIIIIILFRSERNPKIKPSPYKLQTESVIIPIKKQKSKEGFGVKLINVYY